MHYNSCSCRVWVSWSNWSAPVCTRPILDPVSEMISALYSLFTSSKLGISIVPSNDGCFIYWQGECMSTCRSRGWLVLVHSHIPFPSPRSAPWSEPECCPKHSPAKPKDLFRETYADISEGAGCAVWEPARTWNSSIGHRRPLSAAKPVRLSSRW